jgi:mevalonate kinase
MIFYASAPATLMLMGEHAVLHKKLALVSAINQRIHVALSPRSDSKIVIHSALGDYQTEIEQLAITKPFQFVLGSLLSVKSLLKLGCEIRVTAEFSDKLGLGSSAAVTVATITAIHQCLKLSLAPNDLILHSREVVRNAQGLGSGADVAASVLGGTVLYRTEPFLAEQLLFNPKLCAVYSGSKMPTREVIDIVEAHRSKQLEAFDGYFNEIEAQVLEAKAAINTKDWSKFAQCLKANQQLMQKLGVSNAHLEQIIDNLEAQDTILAAKISGSGLGDCIIGLGELKAQIFPRNANEVNLGIKHIPIEISQQGVSYGIE